MGQSYSWDSVLYLGDSNTFVVKVMLSHGNIFTTATALHINLFKKYKARNVWNPPERRE